MGYIDVEIKVECEGEFCYLGDLTGSRGGAESASRVKFCKCKCSPFLIISAF